MTVSRAPSRTGQRPGIRRDRSLLQVPEKLLKRARLEFRPGGDLEPAAGPQMPEQAGIGRMAELVTHAQLDIAAPARPPGPLLLDGCPQEAVPEVAKVGSSRPPHAGAEEGLRGCRRI